MCHVTCVLETDYDSTSSPPYVQLADDTLQDHTVADDTATGVTSSATILRNVYDDDLTDPNTNLDSIRVNDGGETFDVMSYNNDIVAPVGLEPSQGHMSHDDGSIEKCIDDVTVDVVPRWSIVAKKLAFWLPLYALVLCVIDSVSIGLLLQTSSLSVRPIATVMYCFDHFVQAVSVIAVIFAGFHLTSKLKCKHAGYGGVAALFLFPMFWIFLFDWLRLIANVGVFVELQQNSANLTIAKCSLDLDHFSMAFEFMGILVHMFAIFVQTAFALHCFQLVSPPFGSEASVTQPRKIFKAILFFLMLVNIYIWMQVSFVTDENGFNVDCLTANYFHASYPSILHATLPVYVFYRFQSFMTFLILYLKY